MIIPYLNFAGNCREAVNFYKDCLKADLNVVAYGDMDPNTPAASKDRVMHASLSVGGKPVLMASDTWEGAKFSMGNAFSVSVHPASADEATSVWAAFSESAKVTQPLADAPWGALYGALTDKFGVQWMFNYEYPKQ